MDVKTMEEFQIVNMQWTDQQEIRCVGIDELQTYKLISCPDVQPDVCPEDTTYS